MPSRLFLLKKARLVTWYEVERCAPDAYIFSLRKWDKRKARKSNKKSFSKPFFQIAGNSNFFQRAFS